MKTPRYIQRLKKPVDYINPFDGFGGGGKKDGGIAENVMVILRKIFTFDYMGSAEFEWGAVPTALKKLSLSKLVTKTLNDNIYIIAPEAIIEDVLNWVDKASIGEHGNLKERLGFKEALDGDKYAETVGWLKIEEDRYCEEPFMFFIDKQMFDDVCQLFQIEM